MSPPRSEEKTAPGLRRWSERLQRQQVALTLVLAFVGLAAVVAASGVLAWDGSLYFFVTLQEERALTVHNRVGMWPMTRLLLAASELTQNTSALVWVFGAALALVPCIALAGSLALLRAEKASLRFWPVAGILVAPLPSQICLVAESAMAMQLFWLGWAAFAGGTQLWRVAVTAPVAVWMFTLHPVAGPLLLLLGGGAVYFWLDRRAVVAIAAAVALTGAGCWRVILLLREPAYERDQALAEQTWRVAWDNLSGFPLLLTVTLAAQALVLFWPAVWPVRISRVLWIVTVPAGVLWALHPASWAWSLNWRFPLFPITAMLALVACAHARMRRSSASILPPAVVFAMVLTAQAFTWQQLATRFREALLSSPGVLLQNHLAWTENTALDHWSQPLLAIVLQGREPVTLFAREAESLEPDGVRLGQSYAMRLEQRWFRLEPLRKHLPRPE